MMKKTIALLLFVSVLSSLSAQKVNETVILYGKEQLSGFTINISDATPAIVEGALAEKFQNQFGMKGSKKKGIHVYENQPCSAFGEARYDIYFTSTEVGKKKDKIVQLTLVVSTGNLNCIKFTSDPRTSRNIVAFLEAFPQDVEAYKIKLRIAELKEKLAKLDKERQAIERDQTKIQDKINVTTSEVKGLSDQLDKKNEEIEKLQDQYNQNYDSEVKDQISAAMKEKQSIQKSRDNAQKNLVKLNEDLHKNYTKLENNKKETEAAETELKSLEK